MYDPATDLMYIKIKVEDGRPIKSLGPNTRWSSEWYMANVIAPGAQIEGQRIISATLVPAYN